MPRAHVASAEHLAHVVRDLFPELAGAPVDVDRHAAAVVMRALNDGTPTQHQAILAYFGEARVVEVAQARADRLSNPAYRAWAARLELPPRDARVTFVQGLWRR